MYNPVSYSGPSGWCISLVSESGIINPSYVAIREYGRVMTRESCVCRTGTQIYEDHVRVNNFTIRGSEMIFVGYGILRSRAQDMNATREAGHAPPKANETAIFTRRTRPRFRLHGRQCSGATAGQEARKVQSSAACRPPRGRSESQCLVYNSQHGSRSTSIMTSIIECMSAYVS